MIQFQDELYTFIQKQKRHRKPTVKARFEDQDNMATIIPRFSPVIPNVSLLTVTTATDEHGRFVCFIKLLGFIKIIRCSPRIGLIF